MSWYFDKCLKAVSFAAPVAIVGVSCLACAGLAQGDKVTDDDLLTAEQCIDNNTAGSVEPFEEDLVAQGLVNTELNKINITHGMCEEIIERTPGGSPIARAAVVGNLTQELQIIKKSMEEASGEDVNGDGMVNAEDERIADSASFAAAYAARETLRRANEEGSIDGGGIEELDAAPAAYLAQQQTTSAPGEQTTSAPGELTTSAPGELTTSAPGELTTSAPGELTTATPKKQYERDYASPSYQHARPSSSAKAGAAKAGAAKAGAAKAGAAKAGAAKGRATGTSNAGLLPSREKVQTNASGAARKKGADKKAAAAGGQCAATVGLTDVSFQLVRSHMLFDAPAKEMHWKDTDRTKLVVAPKAWVPIEQLKQEVDQAKKPGVGCIQIGGQMEAHFIPDDDLDITGYEARKQDVILKNGNTWTWLITASERGDHLLHLHVTALVWSESQEGRFRSIPQKPLLFDDYIHVSATGGEVFTDFVGRNWSLLVPIFLTILTAIIIPFVLLPWWRRRHQPDELRDRSSGVPRDDRWI